MGNVVRWTNTSGEKDNLCVGSGRHIQDEDFQMKLENVDRYLTSLLEKGDGSANIWRMNLRTCGMTVEKMEKMKKQYLEAKLDPKFKPNISSFTDFYLTHEDAEGAMKYDPRLLKEIKKDHLQYDLMNPVVSNTESTGQTYKRPVVQEDPRMNPDVQNELRQVLQARRAAAAAAAR